MEVKVHEEHTTQAFYTFYNPPPHTHKLFIEGLIVWSFELGRQIISNHLYSKSHVKCVEKTTILAPDMTNLYIRLIFTYTRE